MSSVTRYVAFELADAEHRDDVRMVERGRQLRFALKATAGCCIGELVRNEFDGDGPVETLVDSAIDDSHSTFANSRRKDVVPETRAGGERVR